MWANVLTKSAASGSIPWLKKLFKPQELDGQVREVDLYLYTRPLNIVNNSLLARTSTSQSEANQHWALVYNFKDDNSFRTVQGNAVDNKLVPDYSKKLPREKGKYYRLGKVRISLRNLKDMVDTNPGNSQPYIVNKENCQEWVSNHVRCLGDSDIVKELENFDTLKETKLVGPIARLAGIVCSELNEITNQASNQYFGPSSRL